MKGISITMLLSSLARAQILGISHSFDRPSDHDAQPHQ